MVGVGGVGSLPCTMELYLKITAAISEHLTSRDASYTLLQNGCSISNMSARSSLSVASKGGGGEGGGDGGGGVGGGCGVGEGGGAGGGAVGRYSKHKLFRTINSRAVTKSESSRSKVAFRVDSTLYSAQLGMNALKYSRVIIPAPFVVCPPSTVESDVT